MMFSKPRGLATDCTASLPNAPRCCELACTPYIRGGTPAAGLYTMCRWTTPWGSCLPVTRCALPLMARWALLLSGSSSFNASGERPPPPPD